VSSRVCTSVITLFSKHSSCSVFLGSRTRYLEEMVTKSKSSVWKEFLHLTLQITSVARRSSLGLTLGRSPNHLQKKPSTRTDRCRKKNFVLSLRHTALMGANDPSSSTTAPADSGTNGVYSATAQTYATPTVPPVLPPVPGTPGMPPPFFPGGATPGGFGPPHRDASRVSLFSKLIP